MQKIWKKLFALLFAVAMMLAVCGFTACAPEDPDPKPPIENTDDPDGPSEGDDPHNTMDRIIEHAEGTVTYRFEAECTDLRGKAGPGYSGTGEEKGMATYGDGASNMNGCVSYLYAEGCSVNFLVVSDRDVENATISLCLGAEFIMVPIIPETFIIRVDPVTNEDLNPVTEDGALGAWDQAFLNYYTVEETGGYEIEEFECSGDSVLDGTLLTGPGAFETFTISTQLSLKKGVNSVSMIIQGLPLQSTVGTMLCIAPVIDYMEITTEAQLGMFGQQNNGYGTDGCKIVG